MHVVKVGHVAPAVIHALPNILSVSLAFMGCIVVNATQNTTTVRAMEFAITMELVHTPLHPLHLLHPLHQQYGLRQGRLQHQGRLKHQGRLFFVLQDVSGTEIHVLNAL